MSSFLESLPGQSLEILQQNYSEMSILRDDQKFLFYNNGIIQREANGYWRSFRPYVTLNVPYVPYLQSTPEFSDKIENLKEFVETSFIYFKTHTLQPEAAFSLIAIMKIANTTLKRLEKRYEQESKPINAKIIEASCLKIESCMIVIRDKMDLKYKSEMHEFLQKLIKDLSYTYSKREELLDVLMKELGNSESIKRIIESPDITLQQVKNFFVVTKPYLVSAERFFCLCEVLLGIYSANGKQFLANIKTLTDKVEELKKNPSEHNQAIMNVRNCIRTLKICSLKLNLDVQNYFNLDGLLVL